MKTSGDKKYSFDEVLEIWLTKTPHFEGSGPHRYDDKSEYCTYCLKPKNFKVQKEKIS